MTVTSQKNRIIHTAVTGQTTFLYDFKVFDEDDIKVFLDNILYTGSYEVTNVGVNNGGSVILTDPILPTDNGKTLSLVRLQKYTQETDYIPYDSFPAQSHEDALDKLTFADIQIDDQLGHTLRAPLSEEADSQLLTIPPIDIRKNKYLFFDDDGSVSIGDGGVGGGGILSVDILADGNSFKMMRVDNTDSNNPRIQVLTPNVSERLVQLNASAKVPEGLYDPGVKDIAVASGASDDMLDIEGTPASPVIRVKGPNTPSTLVQVAPNGLIPANLYSAGVTQVGTQAGAASSMFGWDSVDPAYPKFIVRGPNGPLQSIQLDSGGKIPTELLNFSGLTLLGTFRCDDSCPKPFDTEGTPATPCVAPDYRNPTELYGQTFEDRLSSGSYFVARTPDGEVDGSINVQTADGTGTLQLFKQGDGILFVRSEQPEIATGWYYVEKMISTLAATDIAYNPTGDLIIEETDVNVQLALGKLDQEALSKVNGGLIQGQLSFFLNPLCAAPATDSSNLMRKQEHDAANAALGGRIDAVVADVATNTDDIDDNAVAIIANRNIINVNSADIDQAEADIIANRNVISNHTSSISTQGGEIDVLQATVLGHTSDIADNEALGLSNAGRLNAIDPVLAAKVDPTDYASVSVGGTIKMRVDIPTATVYITNNGSAP